MERDTHMVPDTVRMETGQDFRTGNLDIYWKALDCNIYTDTSKGRRNGSYESLQLFIMIENTSLFSASSGVNGSFEKSATHINWSLL